ncbi:hypothetical protein KFE25_004008 [Diacronema lutheri]|uniref:TIR domain-containing protein n=1 Tax=Diacronema lutheri TaxID=2081491 RepID=A0A8J5XQQ1_DIALT|nr:hypothetical protein KFE25_004008 [Diacronema lutheri]
MAISVAHVVKLLRNTYHEVVLATARPARVARRTRGSAQSWNTPDVRGSNASSERRSCGLLTRSRASVAGGGSPEERSLNTEQKRRQDSPAAQIRATLLRSRGQTAWLEQDRTGRDSNQSRYTDTITRATPGSARTSLPSGSLSHGRVMHMSRARVVPDDRTTGAFELSDLEKLLETALVNARRRQAQIALPAVLTGLSLLFLLVTLQISRHALARDAHLRTGRTIGVAALDFALSAATVLVLVLLGLALQPLASFRPLLALAFAIIAVHGVASGALWCVPLVHAVASGGWTSASALALGSVGAHAAVDLATGLLSLSLCAAAAWPPSSGAHARQLLSGFFTLATSWLALGAGLTVLDALVDAAPDNTRAFGGEDVLDGANTLAALLGALALGVRRARSGLRGALGQLARTKGRSAALAPLIGFGSAHETSPAAVIAAAMRTFRPFELTPQSLGASMFAHAADARAPDAVHACEARSTSCVAPPLLAPSRAPSFSRRAGAQTPSAAESRQRDAHMLNPPAAEKRLGSQRHSIVGGARQQRESTPTADKADYFVVHARADDARLRQRALERWSAHKARAGGPVPVVWLQAHADGVRGGASRIESSLVHLARSRRLLLLCGPSFADDVHVLMLLWAWHQLHGSRSSTGVEIVPVIANAGEADALVASIDAFAVVHTAERLAGDEDGRRFVRALQADSVSRFNELVRGYLPRVTEAIGTYAALQLGVRSDDVVAHAHTPAREPLSACVPHAAPAGGCVADA